MDLYGLLKERNKRYGVVVTNSRGEVLKLCHMTNNLDEARREQRSWQLYSGTHKVAVVDRMMVD